MPVITAVLGGAADDDTSVDNGYSAQSPPAAKKQLLAFETCWRPSSADTTEDDGNDPPAPRKQSLAFTTDKKQDGQFDSFIDGPMRALAPSIRYAVSHIIAFALYYVGRVLELAVVIHENGGERFAHLLSEVFARLCTLNWHFTRLHVQPRIAVDLALIAAMLSGTTRLMQQVRQTGMIAFDYTDCVPAWMRWVK